MASLGLATANKYGFSGAGITENSMASMGLATLKKIWPLGLAH